MMTIPRLAGCWRPVLALSAAALLAPRPLAAPIEFDFKDPKGVNNVAFKLDAPLESINGTASGISGKVTFDPAEPASLKGRIVVAASSLHVGNPTMNGHLHGAQWMDVARHPEITFQSAEVSNVATKGNVTTADLSGTLAIKGTSKRLTVPVQITYLPDKLQARLPQMKGDLLVLRANFKVKRSDFGINRGQFEDKVSDEIELNLSLAGMARK